MPWRWRETYGDNKDWAVDGEAVRRPEGDKSVLTALESPKVLRETKRCECLADCLQLCFPCASIDNGKLALSQVSAEPSLSIWSVLRNAG